MNAERKNVIAGIFPRVSTMIKSAKNLVWMSKKKR